MSVSLPPHDNEVPSARFNRLIRELINGPSTRNCFQRWEIELLLDIDACDLPSWKRTRTLTAYQRAVLRQLEHGTAIPMKLSEYLAGGRKEETSAHTTPSKHPVPRETSLSYREQKVAALVAQGLTDREIADGLGIRVQAVRSRLHRIFRKLGVSDRFDLLFWVLANAHESDHTEPKSPVQRSTEVPRVKGPIEMERIFINEKELASRLQVTLHCVRRWRVLKKGPVFLKLGGGSVRYPVEDLERWLRQQPRGGEPISDGATASPLGDVRKHVSTRRLRLPGGIRQHPQSPRFRSI